MVELLAFFALPLAGYAAARLRFLPEGTFEGLAQYVFAVAVPVFVFRTAVRSTPVDGAPGELAALVLVYILGAGVAMAVGMTAARYLLDARSEDQDRAGIASSHANVVMLGLPATLMVLGTDAVSALAVVVGIHGVAMALLRAGARRLRGTRPTRRPWAEVVEQLQSPIFIALVAGIVLRKFDLGLGGQADEALGAIAFSAVPCALFAFGGILARQRIDRAPDRLQRDGAAALAKLVVHPLVIWVLAAPLGLFGLPGAWVWTAVMLAAMPVGFELLARGKRAGSEPTGATILNISLAAIVTVTALTALMR